MDGWKMKFPIGMAYFQGQAVSFGEGKSWRNFVSKFSATNLIICVFLVQKSLSFFLETPTYILTTN